MTTIVGGRDPWSGRPVIVLPPTHWPKNNPTQVSSAAEQTALGRVIEQEAEIARLRLYIDGMHAKPGSLAHLYRGMCPDSEGPDDSDPDCPACQLLAGVPRGPAAAQ